ncbi:caspase-1-like [Hemicordylus capensis]|uniref:caspase-1-like n=1 Tax=Hemicordylus capensis TaxID=884348 RepID=UPI0023044B4F|nr:caspase-1-like [Hemicordylus capensis]
MADKKLTEVRMLFVECANKAVIKQLLDDLQEKQVLNEEEVEEVKEEKKKQDQAKTLIDQTRKKGANASQIFIECLEKRDHNLTEQLGLKDYLRAPSAVQTPFGFRTPSFPLLSEPSPGPSQPQEVQPLESRCAIKLCPLELFRKIQAEEAGEIYPILDSEKRTHLALIICNIEFDHLSHREGAEMDLVEMKLLLEGLGYKVETEQNLCSEKMSSCLKDFAGREEHKTSDSTFLVLMSHGLRDGLCGVKSRGKGSDILSMDTVFSTFNNLHCPALRGKPKVVIIQACRGENEGFKYVSYSVAVPAASDSPSLCPTEEFESDALRKVHVECDFVCLYSTTPDNVSWRHPQKGSIFIIRLREHIQQHAWNFNLEEIFRKTRRRA